jgi:putative sterol carrier protein
MQEGFTFPGADWLRDFTQRINSSSSYEESAESWEGDIAFVIEAEPDKGLADDAWLWLDLWHGACRDSKVVTSDEGEASAYVIRAPYSRWKSVIRRDLEPIKGMMQGKLKLQGDLPTIIRYVRAATELVNLAATVPTVFPDET